MLQSTALVLQEDSEQPAVIVPSTTEAESLSVSYRNLQTLLASFQKHLAGLGINAGDKVAIVLPNGLDFVVVFLALMHQRAIAAPINPQYKQGEYYETLQQMRPVCVIATSDNEASGPCVLAAKSLGISVARCSKKGLDLSLDRDGEETTTMKESGVVDRKDVQPEDKALLLFTSGTTGAPKAVILTHQNLLVAMSNLIEAHQLSSADRCMLITPLFHVIGIGGSLLTTLFTGGCAIIPTSLPGNFWQVCKDFGATWFHAVPTLHRLLLSFPRPKQMPALRFMRSGGSDLSPELYQSLNNIGFPLLEIYGMTETSPGIFCNRLDGAQLRLAHYPVPKIVEVKILPTAPEVGTNNFSTVLTNEAGTVGEICVRGPSIMSGYADNPKANADAFLPDGFFRTGDLGVLLPDGFLQLTGRIKEIINKGGEKVSPTEIEHIVLSHEAVREAACFRLADKMYGEEIGLAVAFQTGKEVPTAKLKAHVRQRAAMFKVPKVVVIVDAIPTNRTGKPKRIFLSDQYAQGLLT